ncbi:hypothetical protein [Pseudomonas sp. LRF_L74]|uniref:hypothetical protein n=1 Tax=Pseudomonas sp. LRF_L74 TaxID=3369422 RepID=UPI003F626DD2
MSIAYQADVFCDGQEVLGADENPSGCVWFIEQGEVQHYDAKGLADGAWGGGQGERLAACSDAPVERLQAPMSRVLCGVPATIQGRRCCMKPAEFRAELNKIMPGYKWTIHKTRNPAHTLLATGIQSSGFNRLSTLRVERRENYAGSGVPRYEAESAGYGTKAPWVHACTGRTLAQALRNLQDHYQAMANKYCGLVGDLKVGRGSAAQALEVRP